MDYICKKCLTSVVHRQPTSVSINVGFQILNDVFGISSIATQQRSYHGNSRYKAFRSSKKKARNVFTPMETLHNLQRGEKQINRYTDKYMARSDKFVPVSKLPAPRWNWDYDLTEENTEFLQQAVKDNNQRLMQLQREQSLLNDEEWPVTAWTPDSLRCGAVGIKLGVHPLWFKDGSYANCTLLQILECHAIKYFSKDEYNGRSAAMLVGAKNGSTFYRNEKYSKFCLDAGVPVKRKCFRFIVSEDAALKPGTEITASHFRTGQYVDCTAKSVGYGMQGVMQRWQFKGGPADNRGSHKFHRRPGAIGSGRSGHVDKGKKMPGQLGGTYETIKALKVLRINTRYNVLYVKGRIPGHINQFVKIQDSHVRRPKNEQDAQKLIGPFPTYMDDESTLPEEIYDDSVLPLNHQSVSF